ncbi:hypothetical protein CAUPRSCDRAFT_11298, partial [Caulochytrium protostelioides]
MKLLSALAASAYLIHGIRGAPALSSLFKRQQTCSNVFEAGNATAAVAGPPLQGYSYSWLQSFRVPDTFYPCAITFPIEKTSVLSTVSIAIFNSSVSQLDIVAGNATAFVSGIGIISPGNEALSFTFCESHAPLMQANETLTFTLTMETPAQNLTLRYSSDSGVGLFFNTKAQTVSSIQAYGLPFTLLTSATPPHCSSVSSPALAPTNGTLVPMNVTVPQNSSAQLNQTRTRTRTRALAQTLTTLPAFTTAVASDTTTDEAEATPEKSVSPPPTKPTEIQTIPVVTSLAELIPTDVATTTAARTTTPNRWVFVPR